MKEPMRQLIACLVPLLFAAGTLGASEPPSPPREPIPVLLLGTFHFKDAGLDDYRPEHDVDILSEPRQKEVEEVVRCLSRFRPTVVAVEAMPERRESLRAQFQEYVGGELELPANEIFQLGFRLAARNGLDRVHPVDAKGRWYDPYVDPDDWAAEKGQAKRLTASEGPWEEFYRDLYSHEDLAKTERSLREQFLAMNDEQRILLGHGHYLIGSFKVGEGSEYPGVDAKIGWYSRNLRIFANLQRTVSGSDDRLLLIIGAGHLPILRHSVEASPEFRLVEGREYLELGCGGEDSEAEVGAESGRQPP